MKKFIALFLIIAIIGLLVMSCDNGDKPNPDLTTESTAPSQTTSSQPDGTTTTTSSSTTSTTAYVPYINDKYEKDETDSLKVRVLKDENDKFYAVAITNFLNTPATLNVPSTYTYKNIEYPVIQIGTGAKSQGSVCSGTALKTLNVPSSIKYIGMSSFFQAKSLQTVTLAEGVETIGNFCFYICDNLTTVSLPSTLKSIGEYAFFCCVSLESIVIPSSVTEIGTQAFAGCANLKSVTLPRAFEAQAAKIFADCSSSLVITYVG